MGLNIFFSSSSYDNKNNSCRNSYQSSSQTTNTNLPNPDPGNYKITSHTIVGKYLIIEINYPDCTNYEGNKILLYDNCTIEELRNQKTIDPHFSESTKFFSPVARFQPNTRGWSMAYELAQLLNDKNK